MIVSRMFRPCRARRRAAIGCASLLFVIGPLAASAHAAAYSTDQITRLDTLVFRTSLDSFLRTAARPSVSDSSFDWSTDHCSAPLVGSTGRSFDFTPACTRHDFAYRNYKRADMAGAQRGQWWNSRMRQRIDHQFHQDMLDHCARRASTDRPTCRLWAETFFRMVRIAGGP